MKIVLAQLNYHVGNFSDNALKIIEAIEFGKSKSADLVVFSELAVCGYIPHDLLEQRDFVDKATHTAVEIAAHCTGIAAILGCPTINTNEKGKHLFNSALFLCNGRIERIIHKTLLPTYDIFDEYRYFEPNDCFSLIEFNNYKIAVTICEDLWDEQESQTEFVNEKLYKQAPLQVLSAMGANLVINIAGSPFSYNQSELRKTVLLKNAAHYQLPIIYVNQVGAQTEVVFDGGSLVINKNGQIVSELAYFEEEIRLFDTSEINSTTPVRLTEINKIEKIHKALVLGISDYFSKMKFTKAVLGMSGGIDSALTLALAAEALGNRNVHALLMPSRFSSKGSVDDSVDMLKRLNSSYDIISIEDMYMQCLGSLHDHLPKDAPGIAGENLQARIRGLMLMAYSNRYGHILLNTSNKSEAAVGYTTLYGDMSGGLSVLGDVYKTDVYALSELVNRSQEIIPRNIITKAPSAELRYDQKDSDSFPEYPLLDSILFEYIERKKSPSEIISAGFDEAIVRKVINLVDSNEYKRFQAPPIIRVSSKAFGFGLRMPLVAKF